MTARTERAEPAGPAEAPGEMAAGPALPAADAELAAAIDEQLVRQLAGRAEAAGLSLTGEGGLLERLTKMVLEGALEGEMDDHLGYDQHDAAGGEGGNSRNGHRSKTVITEVGPVEIEVPRDRDASFEPQIVAKRQRRLTGVDDLVISLVAKGLTTGEVQAHLAEVYGAEVSRETISTITDQVLDGMAEWQNRPLDAVYPVIFIDAINVKIRDGQVANRPIYVALAVTVDGDRDILGLWAGDGGEGAKYWLQVLTEIKNRGVAGRAASSSATGSRACPTRSAPSGRRRSPRPAWCTCCATASATPASSDWAAIAKALKPVYTAPTEAAAMERFLEFAEAWERALPGDRAAVGERLGRVRAVPGLRPRDPHGHLHHQRDRVASTPASAGRSRPAVTSRTSRPP